MDSETLLYLLLLIGTGVAIVIGVRIAWALLKIGSKGIAKNIAKGIEEGKDEARRQRQADKEDR